MSLAAVGITIPQLLWMADLLTGANHRHDQLHVQLQAIGLRPRPLVLPRLAAVHFDLGRLAPGIRIAGDLLGWTVRSP